MSLVGSLEDLGLGDILQIVSLSRKSGTLQLSSDAGDGQILLCEGLVRGASIKGEYESLRDLLLAKQTVTDDDLLRADALTVKNGGDFCAAVVECAAIEPEQIESLHRDHVEHAVFRMFSWRSGEFNFEVGEVANIERDQILLTNGINPQYLAMEASRQRDESMRPGSLPEIEDESAEDLPMFSGETESEKSPPESNAGADPVDELAFASARNAEAEDLQSEPERESSTEAAEASGGAEEADAAAPVGEEAPAVREAAAEKVRPVEVEPVSPAPVAVQASEAPNPEKSGSALRAPGHPVCAHLVVIDPNLAGLEWFKAALEGMFQRVHIFQRTEAGLERIRHFLGRGVLPLVVLSDRSGGDLPPAVRNVNYMVGRLRVLAARMPIVALAEYEADAPKIKGVKVVVVRPASPGVDPDHWGRFESLRERLREDLSLWSEQLDAPTSEAADAGVSTVRALTPLRVMAERLRAPSAQGDIMSLVLGFSAERFSRVAIFVVRDEVTVGMVQRGMPETGGPDNEALAGIQFDRDTQPELFRRVVEESGPVRSSMRDQGNHRLAMLLGGRAPGEAYAAPIESGGCVVAILYADNMPDEGALRDTGEIESVLQEAGLALDRALLRRTLDSLDDRD